MARIIAFECGTVVRGDTDRELLAGARAHIESNHPAVAEEITDDDLLALSEEVSPTAPQSQQAPQPSEEPAICGAF
jgi:predicted small metal-binding protein